MRHSFDEQGICDIARRVRVRVLDQVMAAKSGHIGGSFSCAEILTVLYFGVMNVRPEEPRWSDRDRFVLSKGHCTPALYAVLAERGFFGVHELQGFRRVASILQGHPDMLLTPGVDMTTGSLGQGLSAAVGMAVALRARRSPARVFALLGDGELQEGHIWEALMCSAHCGLDNLCVIVDENGLQIDGTTAEVMALGSIPRKLESFGLGAVAIDGHDPGAIRDALSARMGDGKPAAVVAKTIKGKGVSFMENNLKWHGSVPTVEEAEAAYRELRKR